MEKRKRNADGRFARSISRARLLREASRAVSIRDLASRLGVSRQHVYNLLEAFGVEAKIIFAPMKDSA